MPVLPSFFFLHILLCCSCIPPYGTHLTFCHVAVVDYFSVLCPLPYLPSPRPSQETQKNKETAVWTNRTNVERFDLIVLSTAYLYKIFLKGISTSLRYYTAVMPLGSNRPKFASYCCWLLAALQLLFCPISFLFILYFHSSHLLHQVPGIKHHAERDAILGQAVLLLQKIKINDSHLWPTFWCKSDPRRSGLSVIYNLHHPAA